MTLQITIWNANEGRVESATNELLKIRLNSNYFEIIFP